MDVMRQYGEQIYAGVLGKIIGVYLGRPVEGWAYEKIRDVFGEVNYYKHRECGVPFIVADDDISGTFAFFRALEDNGYKRNLSSQEVGETWRNYIIEDKTILWWGGLGRSTEHTAFLNLKQGIPAPRSGSIEQNGRTLAEQIGAQIFMDAFAMACPDDPETAVRLVRAAASVSHDGLAVEAACYLAAMEAMAFSEKSLERLLDGGLRFVSDPRLLDLIEDVRNICAKNRDWRAVRERLNEKYGYHLYPGCCHMVPNHAMVLASLLLGGDSFQRAIQIAASAGWDTDCNAGNVGCLNGIRLGLAGIDAGADLRGPVADRLYVVSSDGGGVVSDAVQQARTIVRAAAALRKEPLPTPQPRFSFSFPGSVQGFSPCPYGDSLQPNVWVDNVLLPSGGRALALHCLGIGPGAEAHVSTPTFLEKGKTAANFSTVASPTLYETQRIRMVLSGAAGVDCTPYVLYADRKDAIQRLTGPQTTLGGGSQEIAWTIPSTEGMPILRVGLTVSSPRRFDGTIYLHSLDWSGAPASYALRGMLMTSIWNTNPSWLQSWVSSAKHFQADFNVTVCISHPEENGAATIGTSDWADYAVSSALTFSLHQAGGLVLRCKGHRRYYAAVLCRPGKAEILCRRDSAVRILAEAAFPYREDTPYLLRFSAKGSRLQLEINGELLLQTDDDTYASGSAGFLVDRGTICADGFYIDNREDTP